MSLIVYGFNHRNTPIAIREKLSIGESELEEVYQLFLNAHLEQSVILSTCNRLEIYSESDHPAQHFQKIAHLISEYKKIPLEDFHSHAYHFVGDLAFQHGFRVACGLDSLVIGENQVLGQMKRAYDAALAYGMNLKSLHRYFHKAFSLSKKIRTETSMGEFPINLSYVAVMLVKRIFGSMEGRKALLLGAGKMGELAAKHLYSQGAPEIFIANRSIEKAEEIAKNIQAEVVKFENYPSLLTEVDVVICSTAANNYLIEASHVKEVMKLRKNNPIFFIDISLPRNIDPEVNDVYNVYLYDIDDLKTVVDDNLKERKQLAKLAEEIISRELDLFKEELSRAVLNPAFRKWSEKVEAIRGEELEKLFKKMKHFNEEDKNVLDLFSQALINKILHSPRKVLKEKGLSTEIFENADSLRLLEELFEL